MKKVIFIFKKSVKLNGFLKSLIFFFQLCLIKTSIQNCIWINKKTRVYLRKGTSDFPVFRQIFLEGEYQFDYGKEVNTIVDAGANIGLASVFFSLLYKDSKIICIEPEKANYEVLLKNTKAFPNIIPVQGGVWYKNDILQICPSDKFGEWGFQLSDKKKSTNKIEVSSYTINTLMKNHNISHIDILKIDVEGAEKEIFLKGETEDWLPYCKYIVMEIHEFLHPGLSKQIFERISEIVPFQKWKIGENTFILNEKRGKDENICYKP